MAAQDNLSQELFFTAHRGLTQAPAKGKGLGVHWSADKDVAEAFAGAENPEELPNTVVTARIPMSSVETDTKTLTKNAVLNKKGKKIGPTEEEVPVKKGAPIHVEKIVSTRVRDADDRYVYSYRTRTKRFNPPKEMLA